MTNYLNNHARQFLHLAGITGAEVMTDDYAAILRKLDELHTIGKEHSSHVN
jgi:hypothetical protein